MQYTNMVLDHFTSPRNFGEIPDADGIGTIGSEECGDMIQVWIKVSQDGHLSDIKYKVFGCPAVIACCSIMTELVMGKYLDVAGELTDEQVADALGGLPVNKYHCSNLAASALHRAIMDYVLQNSNTTNTITITTLINDEATDNIQSEHGLSLWLEYGDKHVLFDTGQTDMILRNAELLGIHLDSTDAIVISHGHYDHTGGLKAVLDIAPKAKIYLHPEALGPKYSQKDKQVKKIGMPDSAKEVICDLAGKGRIVWTEIPTEIIPGLFVTSRIPRNTDFEDSGGKFFIHPCCQTIDELLDDQAIFFETKQGLVVLLGCAHAGVVNTLNYVTKLIQQSHIHAVIGGMHLMNANLKRIENTIETFGKYDVQIIVPLHCTGKEAAEKIQKASGDKYRPLKAGAKIVF
jgi:7,8-dihydropterin-6-yl-methyl-4-(beta-D-ribofuranosyl)aminobenzene 5'-phosphate synthase